MFHSALIIVVFSLLYACATPIAPTGGPRDQTGPVIVKSEPVSGTTNFSGQKFDFYFDEYINRSSVAKEINVEPDLGLEYSIRWKKKRMTLEFEEELPDSTTIIITLGSDISDVRNNKMGKPITLAISTGDEIDEGKITGRIKNALDGSSAGKVRVLLYRTPVDLEAPATYLAETDTSGRFIFSYLREGTYKAIYVDDRNRNKVWESSETAQPFNKEFVALEKAGADTLDTIYIIRRDTLAPKLQGVGLFSANRMRLRFNENIYVRDGVSIRVTDSLSNTFSNAYPLYISKEDPFVLFAQSDEALTEGANFGVELQGITDASNNQAISSGVQFLGSAQEDTTSQRIIDHITEKGVFPDEPFVIRYAAPITDPMITDSLVLIEGDVTFDNWPEINTDRNILSVLPQDSWIEGIEYQILVWNPVTKRRKLYKPEVWDQIETGNLEITVDGDSTGVYMFSLSNKDTEIQIDSSFTGNITIENLPPVGYSLTVFKDADGNGVWDNGTVSPYRVPELYYIQRSVKVQTGFTSEVNIIF